MMWWRGLKNAVPQSTFFVSDHFKIGFRNPTRNWTVWWFSADVADRSLDVPDARENHFVYLSYLNHEIKALSTIQTCISELFSIRRVLFMCYKILILQWLTWCFLFQFTAWVDAVIFVFSLENEASFNAIYSYYTKMAHYRNSAEIPLILVGTQGYFSIPIFL